LEGFLDRVTFEMEEKGFRGKVAFDPQTLEGINYYSSSQ
jgi:hypothetical protein